MVLVSYAIFVDKKLKIFLLCGITHAQHTVGKMSVITKGAVCSQKLLVVPGL